MVNVCLERGRIDALGVTILWVHAGNPFSRTAVASRALAKTLLKCPPGANADYNHSGAMVIPASSTVIVLESAAQRQQKRKRVDVFRTAQRVGAVRQFIGFYAEAQS